MGLALKPIHGLKTHHANNLSHHRSFRQVESVGQTGHFLKRSQLICLLANPAGRFFKQEYSLWGCHRNEAVA